MRSFSPLSRAGFSCRKVVSLWITISFTATIIFSPRLSFAIENFGTDVNLPLPRQMISCSQPYEPALIQGMTVHPENPLLFDFIIDAGDSQLGGSALQKEALRMVKYFLAAMTIPDREMWVNLSPEEPDRIVPEALGRTVLGRDLLAQDYMLKQITSSLMFPEEKLGEAFWKRVYAEAYERFGTTDVPMDTYNKVWVVPSKAAVYEEGDNVYIMNRQLKVMLAQDYKKMRVVDSVRDSQAADGTLTEDADAFKSQAVAHKVLKEIIVPELEKEVNQRRHFANLRQIYNAMILAKWYKENLKQSLLGQVYADQNKVAGIHNHDPEIKNKIYDQYITAFKKGVYDIIRQEYDPIEQTVIPRKYFSGGLWGLQNVPIERFSEDDNVDFAMATGQEGAPSRFSVQVGLVEANDQLVSSAQELHDILDVPFEDLQVRLVQTKVKELLQRFREKQHTMIDVGEEYMAPGLGPFAEFIASGGLGFLSGEFNAAGQKMMKTALASFTMAYKTRKDTQTGEFKKIDYERLPNVYPVNVEGPQGTNPFVYSVDFKGNYHQGAYGQSYRANLKMVDNDGNPLFLVGVPEEPNLYHHLYDDFNDDEKRWIQYGLNARLLVEAIKNTGSAPDTIRLNEGHMAFVYPAIRNDIEYHRSLGEKSIFEGVKIIYTNHTPEFAGIPAIGDIPRLKRLVGEDLVPDYMLTEGHFHSLEAMAQIALYQDPQETGIELIINGVSQEHYEVIVKLLLQRFPEARRAVTYVQNASRAKDWFSARLAQAIEEHGVANITGQMLLEIAEQNKNEINSGLRNIYAQDAAKFYDGLQKHMPSLAFMKRWEKYKNSEPYLALVKWILGDANKKYQHPAIQDLSSLENPKSMESVFLNPQWVVSPGLDIFMRRAEETKAKLRQDPDGFIETIDQELLDQVPALSFVRDWDQYKGTPAFTALVRWILGDAGQTYSHPEINDLSVLQSTAQLEAVFIQPKWVESPGLDLMGREAKTIKAEFSENKLNELVPQFDRELVQKRPVVAFLRRWVQYKEAGVLLSLMKWIVGDKDKVYDHPKIEDISVLQDPEKLASVLQDPEWVKGPGLEMLVMAGGKSQGEPVGMEWLRQFKELSKQPDLKGRLVVVEDTGFPVMRLAAGASTVLYNVPDPTREASGTSQQRWGLNGKPVIAIKGAGMSAQIKHNVSGWILDPFPERSLEELIRDFNPQDPGRIERARRDFRKRVTVLDSYYFQEAADLYYNRREELAEMMLNAFRHAYDTVRMERMVQEYELLGISLKNGFGISGFHAARRQMYLEDLLVKVYRWHPRLQEQGVSLTALRTYLQEVWSPLDELELGQEELDRILASDENTETYLIEQGMQKAQDGLWYPMERVFTPDYFDMVDSPDRTQGQDTAMAADPAKPAQNYGGINLDPQLLDLQVRRDQDGVPLPLVHQPVDQMRINGFIPVILNIQPFTPPMVKR
jgi:glucan phosphorylase